MGESLASLRSSLRRVPSSLAALCLVGLAAAGCGTGLISATVIALSGGSGGGARATATVDGSVETLQLQVGANGCVSWSTPTGCSGSLCGLAPGTTYLVTCDDPILAQWRDDWTVISTHWSAPQLQLAGAIIVEPASSWGVPPQLGSIVTDPGHSAYVLRLDTPNLPPTRIELRIDFDRGAHLDDCVEGVRVVTAIGTTGDRWLVPADAAGLDFSALQAPDPHVFCIDTVPVRRWSWHEVKRSYR
jgi:hypothetical protein